MVCYRDPLQPRHDGHVDRDGFARGRPYRYGLPAYKSMATVRLGAAERCPARHGIFFMHRRE